MKKLTRKVLSATAPVFGVFIAIAVLQAAHVPYPPALSIGAWPQWAVFVAVVHTCIALCMFATARLLGEPSLPQIPLQSKA